MKIKKVLFASIFTLAAFVAANAQIKDFTSVSASVHPEQAKLMIDNNQKTGWQLEKSDLEHDQFSMLTLNSPGDLIEITLQTSALSKTELKNLLSVYVTYDPMNPGEALDYYISGKKVFTLKFEPKYGAHLKLKINGGAASQAVSIFELGIKYDSKNKITTSANVDDQPWRNAALPVEERVESLLAAMTPADKMELIREGWGIPGIPHLGIPFLNKVEAIHGYSYGSGATIFPQAIGMGATWNKQLVEEVAQTIGDETVSAKTLQAWSPVLDVAQDARWRRCEETYGEDPVLVSQIGGAWIKGYQSKGLMVTPKHFAAHGAPLGGRDSHDIGLSERELREIHLVSFRHVIETYHCQSIMMAYSDFLGVPVAKSSELLNGILREEWGFDGYIVSDCGALGNLTNRKHYTATNFVEAANQALAAGIATNCGDTYNNKEVIEAAKNGQLNEENLNNVCRTMLRTIIRNGLMENNPAKSLDWDKIYPGWNSAEHKAVALQAARESIVLLENKEEMLPLSKTVKTIAVIGPGADDLQPGNYTAKLQSGQLKSVLTGIKATVSKSTKVNFVKGCEFVSSENSNFEEAIKTAKASDVVVMVLGDCSTSKASQGVQKTSGEANGWATLILPGLQQKLLEAVCATGKPVVLVLQVGRPYNISFAAENCKAILVNWLPGQEGGYATADVLFGDYNPGGRLPMTFPRHVGQLPLYYNFKTSGRGYDYRDLPFSPLYAFGYGLSYTRFQYSGLKTKIQENGSVSISATVKNAGAVEGDEVVQLYVTDLYASVKTRVMELKDFNWINLAPDESKTVEFMLTPYELSLLNDHMDRVVEAGDFNIFVGGHSPSFKATDRIKESVNFESDFDGVSTSLNYAQSLKAQFDIEISKVDENLIGHQKTVTVKVKNSGNLTDVGKVKLFADGEFTSEKHHFELAPGLEKMIDFKVPFSSEKQQITFTTKYKSLSVDLGE